MVELKEEEKKDCCRDAWIAGVHAADKIFKSTVKQAMDELDDDDFIVWIRGYVGA